MGEITGPAQQDRAPARWLAYCLTKPGAWQDQPWQDDVVTKVGDKIFAFLGTGHGAGPETIGLKCGNREAADLLIERYPQAAAKMAYIGAHGWNSFLLDGTIVDDEIQDLVDQSYDLVVAKLPRRLRPSP